MCAPRALVFLRLPPRLRSGLRLTRASTDFPFDFARPRLTGSTSFRLVLPCLEPPLGIYRGHTAGAGSGNCLPIDPIGDISGCKDAVDIGVGRAGADL